jgi:hypothetical protein
MKGRVPLPCEAMAHSPKFSLSSFLTLTEAIWMKYPLSFAEILHFEQYPVHDLDCGVSQIAFLSSV